MDKIFNFASQPYDGQTDPSEFLKSFQIQAAMFNWDATKQAAIISCFLKGKAEEVYKALDNTKKASMDEIKAALLDQCKLSTSVLLDAFHSRRKKSDETYSKYGRVLLDLLTKAMPSLKDEEKTSFLRSQLVKFLPDQLRLMVSFNSDKKWKKC